MLGKADENGGEGVVSRELDPDSSLAWERQ
jgi:hypothetical protein